MFLKQSLHGRSDLLLQRALYTPANQRVSKQKKNSTYLPTLLGRLSAAVRPHHYVSVLSSVAAEQTLLSFPTRVEAFCFLLPHQHAPSCLEAAAAAFCVWLRQLPPSTSSAPSSARARLSVSAAETLWLTEGCTSPVFVVYHIVHSSTSGSHSPPSLSAYLFRNFHHEKNIHFLSKNSAKY